MPAKPSPRYAHENWQEVKFAPDAVRNHEVWADILSNDYEKYTCASCGFIFARLKGQPHAGYCRSCKCEHTVHTSDAFDAFIDSIRDDRHKMLRGLKSTLLQCGCTAHRVRYEIVDMTDAKLQIREPVLYTRETPPRNIIDLTNEPSTPPPPRCRTIPSFAALVPSLIAGTPVNIPPTPPPRTARIQVASPMDEPRVLFSPIPDTPPRVQRPPPDADDLRVHDRLCIALGEHPDVTSYRMDCWRRVENAREQECNAEGVRYYIYANLDVCRDSPAPSPVLEADAGNGLRVHIKRGKNKRPFIAMQSRAGKRGLRRRVAVRV